MILLLLACLPAGPDPSQPCAVFQAASQDLVSPEVDAGLEETLIALAQTAQQRDLSPALRSELTERYRQLATFAQQRSARRTQRVERLVTATLPAFPDHGIEIQRASEPLTRTASPAEASTLVQQLAHARGRQRRMLGQVETLCTPAAQD